MTDPLLELENIIKVLSMFEFEYLRDTTNQTLANKILEWIQKKESLESKLNEKLEKAEKYEELDIYSSIQKGYFDNGYDKYIATGENNTNDIKIVNEQPVHGLNIEQQIKQLKRQLEHECKNTECWRIENNKLKEENEVWRESSKNSYELTQSLKSQLEIEKEIFSGSRKMVESTQSYEKPARVVIDELRKQNEKLQKVIDEIKKWHYVVADYLEKQDLDHFNVELKSILSEVER